MGTTERVHFKEGVTPTKQKYKCCATVPLGYLFIHPMILTFLPLLAPSVPLGPEAILPRHSSCEMACVRIGLSQKNLQHAAWEKEYRFGPPIRRWSQSRKIATVFTVRENPLPRL